MFSRWRAQRAEIPRLMVYWDEMVTGANVRESRQILDPSVTETVLAAHQGYNKRAADSDFSARLLKELTRSFQAELVRQFVPPPSEHAGFPANGRTKIALPTPPVEAPSPARRRMALAAACSALVLAGLFGGYFAFNRGDDREPASIPAVIDGSPAATPIATPVPDFTVETLLEHHFAAGELELSDDDFFIWNRYSLAPGSTLRYPNACGAPKVAVAYLESGTFSVRAEGPLAVIRGGVTETIPAGDEVSLVAGDSYIYLNSTGDLLTGFRNPGPAPLVVTEAIWRLNECVEGPPDANAIVWDSYDYEPAIDPDRPVVISLRRILAQPGVVLPNEGPSGVGWLSSDTRILERVYVEAGNLEVIKTVPNASGTPTAQRVYQYPEGRIGIGGTFTFDLDMDPAGTTFLLDNSGGDPLLISAFTVAYESTEAAGILPLPAEP